MESIVHCCRLPVQLEQVKRKKSKSKFRASIVIASWHNTQQYTNTWHVKAERGNRQRCYRHLQMKRRKKSYSLCKWLKDRKEVTVSHSTLLNEREQQSHEQVTERVTRGGLKKNNTREKARGDEVHRDRQRSRKWEKREQLCRALFFFLIVWVSLVHLVQGSWLSWLWRASYGPLRRTCQCVAHSVTLNSQGGKLILNTLLLCAHFEMSGKINWQRFHWWLGSPCACSKIKVSWRW